MAWFWATLIVRDDVGAAAKALLDAAYGFNTSQWMSKEQLRRDSDPAGTSSHKVAHGAFTEAQWSELLDVLTTATQGIRDSVDWQGKPGTPVEDARWAIAYEGADIVAAYRLSQEGTTTYEAPRQAILGHGFVFTREDGDP